MALALTKTRHLLVECLGFYGGNRALFRALILQRFDARVGLAFLVVGFSGQIFGAIGIVTTSTMTLVLYVAIPLLVAAYLLMRNRRSRNTDAEYDREKDRFQRAAGGQR